MNYNAIAYKMDELGIASKCELCKYLRSDGYCGDLVSPLAYKCRNNKIKYYFKPTDNFKKLVEYIIDMNGEMNEE